MFEFVDCVCNIMERFGDKGKGLSLEVWLLVFVIVMEVVFVVEVEIVLDFILLLSFKVECEGFLFYVRLSCDSIVLVRFVKGSIVFVGSWLDSNGLCNVFVNGVEGWIVVKLLMFSIEFLGVVLVISVLVIV